MTHTKIEDVLLDDRFYAWFLHSDAEEVKRWNNWRCESSFNRVLLEEAVGVLRSLIAIQDEEGFPKKIHAVHSRIQRALQNKKIVADVCSSSNQAMIDMDEFECSIS